MNTNDAELVTRSLSGEDKAFEELVTRNQDAVFNLAWRMTGNWHEAADITQEAFIRAFEKLQSYKPEYAFKNWVMSIGANMARNRFRSMSRRRRVEEEQAGMADIVPPPPAAGADDALDEALSRLPEILKVPLVLKHMEEMSYTEIAKTLGIGVSAVKMRVARGRDELVRLLADIKERTGNEKKQ
jgi:RNA polymerase sigma-70 factor (ECF subfamily)